MNTVIIILILIVLLSHICSMSFSGKPNYKPRYGSGKHHKNKGGPSAKIDRYDFKSLLGCKCDSCKGLSTKISYEIRRLNLILQFSYKLYKLKVNMSEYEMRNVLERLIITMGNYSDKKVDMIFYRCTKEDYPVKKALGEILDKSKGNVDKEELHRLFDEFLSDVHAYLDDKSKDNIDAKDVLLKYNLTIKNANFMLFNNEYDQYQHLAKGGSLYVGCGKGAKQTNNVLLKYKMQSERLDKMRERGIFNGACPGCIDYYILCMLIRYECMMPSGQQWGFSREMYTNLANKFGVRVECFGSPKNSQFLLLGEVKDFTARDGTTFRAYDKYYCTLFYDTDYYFGSLGSFFNFDMFKFVDKFGLDECGFMVGPPYIDDIMTKCVEKINADLAKLESSGAKLKLRFVYNMPAWKDSASWLNAKNSKYLVYDKFLASNKHYYINTNRVVFNHQTKKDEPDIIVSRFPSHIFLLEYPKFTDDSTFGNMTYMYEL